MKKLLLRRGHGLALSQNISIKTDQPIAPTSQVDERIIDAAMASLKMHKLASLKIEMQHAQAHRIAQRQTARAASRTNPSDHPTQIP